MLATVPRSHAAVARYAFDTPWPRLNLHRHTENKVSGDGPRRGGCYRGADGLRLVSRGEATRCGLRRALNTQREEYSAIATSGESSRVIIASAERWKPFGGEGADEDGDAEAGTYNTVDERV